MRHKILQHDRFTVFHVDLEQQLAHPDDLRGLELPQALLALRHLGLVISGRLPVWIYAYLTHEAHPFAWVATYDPRLAGAVVVARHTEDSPPIGAIVAVDTMTSDRKRTRESDAND